MEAAYEKSWFLAQLRPQGLARAQVHLQRQGIESFAPKILSATKKPGGPSKVLEPAVLHRSTGPLT